MNQTVSELLAQRLALLEGEISGVRDDLSFYTQRSEESGKDLDALTKQRRDITDFLDAHRLTLNGEK